MIDTVIIKILGLEKFRILESSFFVQEFNIRSFSDLSISERKLRKGNTRYLKKFILHPPSQGIYMPQVEIYETPNLEKATLEYNIQIKFSIPKLLWENSVVEIEESDREKVLRTLHERLRLVGVDIDRQAIADGYVKVLHIAKNILLPTNIRLREIQDVLCKGDLGKNVQVSDTRHIDGGRVVQYRSGVREHVFYDKIADIKQTKTKGADKDRAINEDGIVDICNLADREVLRFEYRLKTSAVTRKEINSFLGRPLTEPILFKEIFSEDLWKKVLNGAWQNLIERSENQLAFLDPINSLDLFLHIMKKASTEDKDGHSQNNALTSFGLALLLKEIGCKAVLDELSRVWSEKAEPRLKNKVLEAVRLTEGISKFDGIDFVTQALQKFEILTLDRLQQGV